jgi:CheY-like chemotaxis protein
MLEVLTRDDAEVILARDGGMLEVLTRDDAEVILARDGEEGLSHIQEGSFDLIVADVIMPKMDGIEMYCQVIDQILAKSSPRQNTTVH